MKLSPYLFFNGDCKEAFQLYQRLLGGKLSLQTHAESPASKSVGPEWQEKIIHARLVFGDNVLMGSDAPPPHYAKPQGSSVSLTVDSTEDAERIFKALSEGARVTMPLQETFWAHRFAMLVDRFGTAWMVNYQKT